MGWLATLIALVLRVEKVGGAGLGDLRPEQQPVDFNTWPD